MGKLNMDLEIERTAVEEDAFLFLKSLSDSIHESRITPIVLDIYGDAVNMIIERDKKIKAEIAQVDTLKVDDADSVIEYLKCTREWYEQGHAEMGDEMSGIVSEGDYAESALLRLIDALRVSNNRFEDIRSKLNTLIGAAKGVLDDDSPNVSLADQKSRWTMRMDKLREALFATEPKP